MNANRVVIQIGQSLLSIVVVFALTAVMLLIGPNLLGGGVIALLYLVPIGWCTVRWGQIAGVSAALSAALCFDFFFIPPYGTFTIGSLEGWLLLLLFIGASILVIGRIQTILSGLQNRERNATFLYEMVAAMANQQTRAGIAQTIANQIQQKYLAELVQVGLSGRGDLPSVVMCAPGGRDCSAKGKPDRTFPVVSGPALIGEVAIWKGILALPLEDDPMLQTFFRQTAAALDRVQAIEENASRVTRVQQENLSN